MDAAGLVKVIEAVRWPVVVILLGAFGIFVLRGDLGGLLGRIKSLEWAKDKFALLFNERIAGIEGDIKDVPPLPPAAPTPAAVPQLPHAKVEVTWAPSKDDALMQYLDEYSLSQAEQMHTGEPAISVMERAWLSVEGTLRFIVEEQGSPSGMFLTGNDLLGKAIKEKLLDRKLLEAIHGLLSLRNDTASAIMGWQPTKAQVAQFVHNSVEVYKLLLPYMGRGRIALGMNS